MVREFACRHRRQRVQSLHQESSPGEGNVGPTVLPESHMNGEDWWGHQVRHNWAPYACKPEINRWMRLKEREEVKTLCRCLIFPFHNFAIGDFFRLALNSWKGLSERLAFAFLKIVLIALACFHFRLHSLVRTEVWQFVLLDNAIKSVDKLFNLRKNPQLFLVFKETYVLYEKHMPRRVL